MLRPYLNFDSAWKAVTQPSRYFVQEIPIYEAKKTDLGKEFAQSGEIDGQNAEKEVLHEAIGIKEVQEEDPGTEARNRQKRRLEAEEWEECIWLIRQQHASKNDEFAQKLVNLVHQKGACDENLLEINVLVMITSPKIIRYLVSEGFKGKAQTIFEDEKLHDSIEDVAKDGQKSEARSDFLQGICLDSSIQKETLRIEHRQPRNFEYAVIQPEDYSELLNLRRRDFEDLYALKNLGSILPYSDNNGSQLNINSDLSSSEGLSEFKESLLLLRKRLIAHKQFSRLNGAGFSQMEAQILVFIFLPEADDDILLEIFRITAITLHTDFEPADILQKFTRKTQRAAIAPSDPRELKTATELPKCEYFGAEDMTYREVRFRTESQQDIEGNDAPETGSQKLPSIVVQFLDIDTHLSDLTGDQLHLMPEMIFEKLLFSW